jgi:ribonucleotide reductase alpha subunit
MNSVALDNVIVLERDYDINYAGQMIFANTYSVCGSSELPQYTFMRIAVALGMGVFSGGKNTGVVSGGTNVSDVIQLYNSLSKKEFTFGSPVLMNAMIKSSGQLMSCFLMGSTDSTDGITTTWKQAGMIGASNGGIGICMSDIRGKGANVANGCKKASGIIKALMTLDSISHNFQEDDRRPTSISVYLSAAHAEYYSS